MSEGKKLELSGHNSVFEPKGENAAAVVLSDAKLRELSGEASVEFFTGGKEGKVAELVKLSEGKQRELSVRRWFPLRPRARARSPLHPPLPFPANDCSCTGRLSCLRQRASVWAASA